MRGDVRGCYGRGVSEDGASIIVRPDVGRWWTAPAGGVARGVLIFSVFGLVAAIDDPRLAVGLPLLGALFGLCFGALGLLAWWAGPLRTTYEVAGGYLTARRGSRVRVRIPVEDVRDLRLLGPLDWRCLTVARMFSYTPFAAPQAVIDVRRNDRWSPDNGERSLPSILLWGDASRAEGERRLREALNLPLDGAA